MRKPTPDEIVIHRGSGEGRGRTQYTVGRVTKATWSPARYPTFTAAEMTTTTTGQHTGWVVPLEVSKAYHAADGLSFGVGADRGWVFTALCRAATGQELHDARAVHAAARDAVLRRRELDRRVSAAFDSPYRRSPGVDEVD